KRRIDAVTIARVIDARIRPIIQPASSARPTSDAITYRGTNMLADVSREIVNDRKTGPAASAAIRMIVDLRSAGVAAVAAVIAGCRPLTIHATAKPTITADTRTGGASMLARSKILGLGQKESSRRVRITCTKEGASGATSARIAAAAASN